MTKDMGKAKVISDFFAPAFTDKNSGILGHWEQKESTK